MERSGAGDDAEFEDFAVGHADRLGRGAYLLTGDRERARDLAQEALLATYRSWSRVRGTEHPLAYVRRTMLNLHLSSRRRRRVAEVLHAEPDEAAEPDRDAYAEHEVVWQALSRLSERQRAALVLRFYEDLTDEEIAVALGCRPSSVRSLISRGIAALRSDPELAPSAGPPAGTGGRRT